MILSDRDIRKAIARSEIGIDGLRDGAIQPASVDLHLSEHPLLVWRYDSGLPIDPTRDNSTAMVEAERQPDGSMVLLPFQFALGSTSESVSIGSGYAGRLEGKSSLARLGLIPHAAAGFFDPGFRGWPTLEFVNFAPRAIILRPGMPIAQMSFIHMASSPSQLYGGEGRSSKYQDQGAAPQPSKYHLNDMEGAPR